MCALGALGLSALLFAALTWQEAVAGPLLRLDGTLRALIAGGSERPGSRPAVAGLLADLGNAQVAVPVLLAAVVYTAGRGRRAGTHRWWLPPLAAVLAMAAVPLFVSAFKAWIGRAGLGSADLYPSGHAATAAVASGAAALLVLPYVRRAAARWLLIAATVPLNLSVGYALVRCGYHWPLDVAGSWLLSGALLSGAALAVRSWSGSPG